MKHVKLGLPLLKIPHSNIPLFFIILSCFTVCWGFLLCKNAKIVMVDHKKVIKIADFETWLHFQFRKAVWQIVQNTDIEILKWFCLAGQDISRNVNWNKQKDLSHFEDFLNQSTSFNTLFCLQISCCVKWEKTSDEQWKYKFNEKSVSPNR